MKLINITDIEGNNVLPIATPFKLLKHIKEDISCFMDKDNLLDFFSECPQFYSDSTISNYEYRIELKKEGSKFRVVSIQDTHPNSKSIQLDEEYWHNTINGSFQTIKRIQRKEG